MEIRYPSSPADFRTYDTKRIREEYHIQSLFTQDNKRIVYSHFDRIIVAGLMPVYNSLTLGGEDELGSEYFLERRELGCINIGGAGVVTAEGQKYPLENGDGLYVGRGVRELLFESVDNSNPAKFYVTSSPAHASYPTVLIKEKSARHLELGTAENCNKRVITQYLHPSVLKTCQLSMGLTRLSPGSNWNTMPCHTHKRRMEVYLYMELGPDDVVFHIMGTPTETRHIVVRNEEAVISPSWSIHSGVGTKAYAFIWAMCGENQDFDDMEPVDMRSLF